MSAWPLGNITIRSNHYLWPLGHGPPLPYIHPCHNTVHNSSDNLSSLLSENYHCSGGEYWRGIKLQV